jgi:beta-galactosidase
MVAMQSRLPRLAFGGDYNPEQWPAEFHEEDVRLMLEAGVDLVTVGVFSWALLEPAPNEFNFSWLDDIIDRLGTAGIRVDLATATASPPPWLARSHPEMLPVTANGTTLWPGGRQAFCPSSPVYRERALVLCRALAERYGKHPALALWHVSNELGCHNALCYCDTSATAFRRWLQAKYGGVEALNQAWGTAFWSQRYSSFEEVLPPRVAPAFPNPTQQLDFRRFSSDELLANFVAERDVLHELSPGIPVTTNFMVMEHIRTMDYFRWAKEVDVVSQDHYLTAEDPHAYQELAFCSDLVRGVSRGAPWILMEQSTSAVNWQPRNVAKRPGELLRSSLQHVARGADGILFFQWRASKAGAEKFHAGMLPHAGTSTRVWREVVELSQVLDRIEDVAGSRSNNQVAILFDWDAWWGCELDSHPSTDVTYLDRAHAFHRGFTDLGIGVDFVHPEGDLSGYSLVVVPTLYSVTPAAAEAIAEAADAGATVVVTYFSGIVDKNDHILVGGYPGAFRDLLGIWTEEFTPLRTGEVVRLSDDSTADVWTEHVHVAGAEARATFVDGPVPGGPAVTRHPWGKGTAWYIACRLDPAGMDRLISGLVREAGVVPVAPTRPGVEVVRRTDAVGTSWTFVINHTEDRASVPLQGFELVAARDVDGSIEVAAGGVAVVRSP